MSEARFDPSRVARLHVDGAEGYLWFEKPDAQGPWDSFHIDTPVVLATDYDALLALYHEATKPRKSHIDIHGDHMKEMCACGHMRQYHVENEGGCCCCTCKVFAIPPIAAEGESR